VGGAGGGRVRGEDRGYEWDQNDQNREEKKLKLKGTVPFSSGSMRFTMKNRPIQTTSTKCQ
jgi:hypothetical protein